MTDPFYGQRPDLIEPPSGGYSFVEWEDLTFETKRVIFKNQFGWRESSFAFLSPDQLVEMDQTVAGLKGSFQIKEAISRLDWAEPGEVAVIERRMNAYLKASPAEIIGIEQLVAANGDRAGRLVDIAEPVHQYTCGIYDGAGFRPSMAGSMVDAITITPPIIAKIEPAKGAFRERIFYKTKIVKLGP